MAPIIHKLGANVAELRAKDPARDRALSQSARSHWHYVSSTRFYGQQKYARGLGDEYVSTEHLLVVLSSVRGMEAFAVLNAAGADRDSLLDALTAVRGTHRVTDQSPENQYQALQRYTRDLTDAARRGKLDPVIGRDEEIRRVIQVLSRRRAYDVL